MEATTRLNFSAATYSAENDEPVMGGFDRRRDYWGQLGTNLALSWML